jgi:folate-binding protein YgfZ
MFSVDQYHAAHNSAALFDRSSQGTVALTGGDRASFLHALLTNDIARLPKGRGVYAAYLTPQGRMVSDMRVIETGSRMLLTVERDLAVPLAERFETLIFSEDVQAKDAGDLALLGVHGPSAARMIQQATGVAVADLAGQYDNVSSESLTIVRDDALGVLGYDVYVPKRDGDAVRARLVEAGAVEASEETAETLRIEAARPRFGIDMNADTIPLEAGLEARAISFTKGCYVGQEVIVRVMHRGHGRVARRLVSLVIANGTVPARGDKILSGDRVVGEITSATGYVQREHAVAGAELTVGGLQARVDQPVN